VVHSEANAILNSNFGNLKGSTLYSTLMPCNECAKLIIQSGIKRIIFLKDRDEWPWIAARRMFDAVKIPYEKYKGRDFEVQFISK
jgi:dCMP deaminase